jgi:uncharacterized protein YbcI
MKPDRSNYQMWFTDFLDGNLSAREVEELKVFLKENSDLNEELNGLTIMLLNPPDFTFSRKEVLARSPECLSEEQFEYLCIANLENDLTPGQKSEMNEIISRDERKRKSFELIRKLKLKPFSASFAGKRIIKKLTTGQKIFRLSVIGLSTAATIAIIVSIFQFTTENKTESTQTAQIITPDTISIESGQPVAVKEPETNTIRNSGRPAFIKSITEILISEVNLTPVQFNQEGPDSLPVFLRPEALNSLKVEIPENFIAAYSPEANSLRVYDPDYTPPLIEYRSNVQLFLARLFHEKIMKDTNSGTRPVESYEIAQAGIKGLNKLFGWEIALHKNTDENGDIRSYNFNSRLLKFNAPVKKPVKAL